MCENPPLVIAGICALKAAFDEYAAKDPNGPKDKLSKKELKMLLEKELGMTEKENEAEVNEIFKDLDENGDGQVDFMEFMVLCVTLACALQFLGQE